MLRDDTLAFFQCVLPAEGLYCAVIFDSPNPRPGIDKPRHQFCNTLDELTDVVLTNDKIGRTVFHACASFIKAGSRKADNAKAVRSLWIDVDAGTGKPYRDAAEAAAAVVQFCRIRALPQPVFVGSGSGIHCYWPLAEALTPDVWRGYATGLKALCLEHGLQIDRTRTADVSSILRPPGTYNRKRGERLVQADSTTFVQGNAASFHELLSSGQPNQRPTDRRHGSVSGSIISSILAGGSYGSTYADTIADGCAQISAFRQSGVMDEPTWYARLGVLAFCVDGDDKGHEWSSHEFSRYSSSETQFKLDRARQLSGATTCAKLNDVSPGICQACPHWGKINSPITVGSDAQPIKVPAQFLEESTGVPQLPVPPEMFRWSATGQLLWVQESPGGDLETTVVLDNPIYLDSVQTGELDGTSYSFKFKKYLPKGGWSEVGVDASILFGANGIATMFGKGLVIHDPKMFLQYVRHQVDDYHDSTETETRYDQFGWKNDDKSFLFGKMLYTSVGPVEAIGAKEVSARAQWLGPKQGGSLPAWTEAADSLFASDMEAISAAVLSSFAAPLMRFQSADEGGAILHLCTPDSGKGKTTALMGAWTVWSAREGLSLTNEDTKVSKPITLGTLANLPVIYDELRDRDPEVIRRMVVMFTEGRDRMRGMVDGTIRHTKANWQTIMLSAANGSLVDQLTGDDTDAPAFRVLELTAALPPNIDKTKGDRLRRTLSENAGHAGDAYLRYLMHPEVLAWTKQALEQWTAEIWRTTNLDAPHRFRVRLVGAIAVAAALVNKLGIVHFQTDRIVQWLVHELGEGRNVGTASVVPSLDRAINALGEFINEHYGETVVVPDKFKAKVHMVPLLKPHNKLSIRYEIATQKVYISNSVFKDWCLKRGFSPRQTMGLLKDHGVLLGDMRPLTLSSGTDIPGAQVQCIEANAAHPVMSGLVSMVTELQAPRALGR